MTYTHQEARFIKQKTKQKTEMVLIMKLEKPQSLNKKINRIEIPNFSKRGKYNNS